MKFQAIVILVLAIVSSAIALKCYQCSSEESWDKCKTTEKSCPSGADRCVKAHVKIEILGKEGNGYAKTCTSKNFCNKDKNAACTAPGVKECDISCCEGNLCNSGSETAISRLLLVSCVVVVLGVFQKL